MVLSLESLDEDIRRTTWVCRYLKNMPTDKKSMETECFGDKIKKIYSSNSECLRVIPFRDIIPSAIKGASSL